LRGVEVQRGGRRLGGVRRRGELEGGGRRMARWKRGATAGAQQRAGQPACSRGSRRGEVEDSGRHRARTSVTPGIDVTDFNKGGEIIHRQKRLKHKLLYLSKKKLPTWCSIS
jgi:hypothetical protein